MCSGAWDRIQCTRETTPPTQGCGQERAKGSALHWTRPEWSKLPARVPLLLLLLLLLQGSALCAVAVDAGGLQMRTLCRRQTSSSSPTGWNYTRHTHRSHSQYTTDTSIHTEGSNCWVYSGASPLRTENKSRK